MASTASTRTSGPSTTTDEQGEHREGRAGIRRTDGYRRAFDVLVSSVLLVLVLPVIVVAAVGSAISLRAWPFFAQDRVGRDGRTFRFFKVRTLRPEVPGYTDKRQLDVSRIPAFCRMLRTLHLDELPQLLLVVVGKMSLVGPRPEMPHLHRRLPVGFAAARTAVRPGCTGMWQVSEASTGLIGEAPEYDAYYLRQRTLRLDVWVLGRTALTMVGIGRPLTLDAVPAWTGRRGADLVIDLSDAAEPAARAVALSATTS